MPKNVDDIIDAIITEIKEKKNKLKKSYGQERKLLPHSFYEKGSGVVEIQSWCEDYIASMEKTFEKRIRFIGIQGSYGRGEAGAESDIDMVLILDVLTMDDLKAYRKSVAAMELSHLVCGFLCGVKELAAWGKK